MINEPQLTDNIELQFICKLCPFLPISQYAVRGTATGRCCSRRLDQVMPEFEKVHFSFLQSCTDSRVFACICRIVPNQSSKESQTIVEPILRPKLLKYCTYLKSV